MISRHHLVEIKCVKELPLSTLSLPHHGLLPRIAVSVRRNHGSPTVSTRVLQHNLPIADLRTAAKSAAIRSPCWTSASGILGSSKAFFVPRAFSPSPFRAPPNDHASGVAVTS